MRIPLPKLRELAEAVRAVVAGPYTTKFPAAVDSVHPNFRGLLKFDPDKCICCGACTRVCPPRAREIVLDRAKGVLRNVHHAERCIYCGQCVLYCTVGDAISHTTEFDASRTERSGDWATSVEREAAICESCGEPFAAQVHLDWIAARVGDLVSANPSLFLSRYRELGLAEPAPPAGDGGAPYRSTSIRVLCPECRRKASVQEEWGY
jgi:formate hydrogenlyase subunit 6/NADH:ubiquinone oxidoreductase subunit I